MPYNPFPFYRQNYYYIPYNYGIPNHNLNNNYNNSANKKINVNTQSQDNSSQHNTKNCNTNNTQEHNNNTKKNRNHDDSYFFEILGIKLHFDDILLICLLFFLYQEGVRDEELFLGLILLLLC